jgi:heptosyltransferase-2
VIQTAFLGDVVLTVPLLTLARNHPDVAWLGLVTTERGADFVDGQALVDDVVVFHKRGEDRGLGGLLRKAAELRTRRPDVALVPHRSFRSAALALRAGIPERVGFDDSAGRWLLTRVVTRSERHHEAERIAGLIEGVGGRPPAGRVPFSLAVPRKARETADRLLAAHGVSAGDDLVVISPGSAWPTKRWHPERFAVVADQLSNSLGAAIVLTGTREDGPSARAVADAMSTQAIDTTGHTGINTLVALIERARILIANDSAPVHLAAGLGTPVVAVFGPTVPGQGFAPYGDLAEVVEAEVECRPCGKHGGRTCPRGEIVCMDSVRSDDVLRAATELLGRRR